MIAPQRTAPAGNAKWVAVGFFWLIYFFNQADRQALFSVFPLIKGDLGLTDTQLGLLGSLFFWVYAGVVPAAGTLGDAVSRKMLVVVALLMWSGATFASGVISSFVALALFRSMVGAAEALYYPAANSMISDYHGQRTRALAMGIHQTSLYFGIVASGALAGYIGQVWGWRAAFLCFGGIGILLALVAFRKLREPERGQSEREDGAFTSLACGVNWYERVRESFRTRTAMALMAAFLAFKLVDAAYLTWMPTLLYRKFTLSLPEAGFHATFWHHAGAAAGVLAGGRVADLLARRTRMSRPLVQVFGLLAGAPFIFMLGWSDSTTVVYASLALFGVCRGIYDSNLVASLYEVVRPESRATATGAMLCVAFLGGGVAPLLIGWLGQQFTLGLAMALTSSFYLIGGLFILADCAFWLNRDLVHMRTTNY